MRRLAGILLVLAAAWSGEARAQGALAALGSAFDALAAAEDAGAFAGNPAGLGARYPDEFRVGFARRDGRVWAASGALVAGPFGAFVAGERGGATATGLALCARGRSASIGFAPTWWRGGERGTFTDLELGVRATPSPWLALGATLDHLGEPRTRVGRLARDYAAGIAVRPLAGSRARAHDLGPRWTLAADVALAEGARRGEARIAFSTEFEPVPGFVLRATGSRTGARVGVSLLGPRASLHAGQVRDRPAGDRGIGDRAYDTFAWSTHRAEDRSLFAPPSARRVAVVRAGGRLADEALSNVTLFGASTSTSSRELHRHLERALEDPLTRGVLLELRGVSGMAQLEELRPRLHALRRAGKPVVALSVYGGGRGDLYLASACDRFVVGEEADFGQLGLRAERRSYKSMLADLGIKVDRASIGRYKSAYRNFSVDSTTTADREVLDRALDLQQGMFVDTLVAARRAARADVERILDGRPWEGADLVAAGLADSLGEKPEALRVLGALTGLGPKPRHVRLGAHPPATREWARRSPIAVVYASGGIGLGRSGSDLLSGAFMGDETIIGQLEHAFRRRDVKAVLLRVDSPGGSSLASARMDAAVQRLKRETQKPLIVSMAASAASGGYFLSAHGDWIVSNAHTRTGSIGVLYVKPSLEGFYAKHRVRQDDFDRGAFMRGWSTNRDWTPADQAVADSAVLRTYRTFVSRVADGRRMSFDAVHDVAQGRVLFGTEALRAGLVDQIGGFEEALAEARRRAGVPAGERIALAEYRRPRSGFLQRWLAGQLRAAWDETMRLPDLAGIQAREAEWLDAWTD